MTKAQKIEYLKEFEGWVETDKETSGDSSFADIDLNDEDMPFG